MLRPSSSALLLAALLALGCGDPGDGEPTFIDAGGGDGGGFDAGQARDGGGSTTRMDAGAGVDAAVDEVDGGEMMTEITCPPPAGAASDATFLDCEGNEVSFHSLCGGDALWLVGYADWCPVCKSFARDQINDIWAEFHPRGVEGMLVITASSSFGSPDAALCAEVRDRYSLEIPVVYDPTGNLSSALGLADNASNAVYDAAFTELWKAQYQDSMVPAQLEAALTN